MIVIARGGGSLEDLLPFSDEALLRAVAACRTPVVSAIGHEQDTPLLDYVADLRASTPTDAAKRIVPDVAEQLALVTQLRDRARRSACAAGSTASRHGSTRPGRARPSPTRCARSSARPSRSTRSSGAPASRVDASLDRAGDDIAHTRARLLALSPAATLRRGYAIVQHGDASASVRSAAGVSAGERAHASGSRKTSSASPRTTSRSRVGFFRDRS